MNALAELLASNVTDPVDFPLPSVAPGLRDLDTALRCPICTDFFDAPVTLACGHCFCSLCVRTPLSAKKECPSCRQTTNESHIRINPAMESAVLAWNMTRPLVLQMFEREREREREAREETVSLVGNTGSISRHSDGIRVPDSKKRKRSAGSDGGSRINTTHSPGPSIAIGKENIRNQEAGCSLTGDLVTCPVCSRLVRENAINAHLDRGCPVPSGEVRSSANGTTSNQKELWSKILGGSVPSASKLKGKEKSDLYGRRAKEVNDEEEEEVEEVEDGPVDRLPTASYDVLKEKKLKDLLLEHNLPTQGDRTTMAVRHQRWVQLFNANLDRSPAQRKSLSQLRSELKAWEKENEKKGKSHVIKDAKAYEKANNAQFKELIAAARPKQVDSSLQDGASVKEEANSTPASSSSISQPRTVDGPRLPSSDDVIVVDSDDEE